MLKHVMAALASGLIGLGAAAPAAAQGSGSATLDAVRARGVLNCGVSGESPGFSFPDNRGVMRGIDADGCRALAAATLGDAEKVRYVHLSTVSRFTALQAGEVDVLIRNTGWSLTREANLGLLFAAPNFWDGTSIIVKTASGVTSVTGLGGASICVASGTSTEINLADWGRANRIEYTPVLISDVNQLREAFLNGRCDAYATDTSQAAAFRYRQGPQANELTILPEQLSFGPIAPMVRKGDDKWFDIVRWVQYAALHAENLKVTSANVDTFGGASNPDIRRLLGTEGGLGQALGLDNRWAYFVIKQMGNYGEVFERNITPLGLARGHNALWTAGGFQFAPAMR
ncbi:amino acid ABC transporter substrate-binding protein [Roseomonas sp. KE2513]|uniref:amino acid ABC transporter substrate-binding protein n=1 Tax=Roseomonas sp. KE2513 TaxID=2479202 RepID=UPI0018DFD85B|nr:amino acid ABC transporter substrate-binding protein [Roseomonas sp. KE2513]MBI0534825.1 amino acid ABC transporter substrate-binding protein [Roseomonas sp. KE2513]